MNEAASPPNIQPPCHNTPAACVTASIQPLCEWSSRSIPGAAELLSKGNFCLARWPQCDMASSRGSVRGLGQGSSSLCVHASWIIVPCHLHCPPGLSAPHWHARSVSWRGRKTLRLIRRNAGRTNDVCFYEKLFVEKKKS